MIDFFKTKYVSTLFSFFCFAFLFFIGCQKKIEWNSFLFPSTHRYTKELKELENPEKHVIILFIHGTMLGNAKTHTDKARFEGFHQYQIIDTIGVHEVEETDTQTEGTKIAIENYTRNYSILHQKKHKLHFFTGGWDGSLSPQKRLRWANNLYVELVQQLKRKNLWNKPNVEIEVHGFSHGGNVALNFARSEDELRQGLTIDRLCLWGTPIQEETGHLAVHHIFNEIFHFYSSKDKAQIIDILSTSRRRSYKNFKKVLPIIPQKIHQINIECNNLHPNHYEFWYLGTPTTSYRPHFPLHPFPLIHFTPLFTALIEYNKPLNTDVKLAIKRKKDKLLLSLHPIKLLPSLFSTHQAISLLCSLGPYGIVTTQKVEAHSFLPWD